MMVAWSFFFLFVSSYVLLYCFFGLLVPCAYIPGLATFLADLLGPTGWLELKLVTSLSSCCKVALSLSGQTGEACSVLEESESGVLNGSSSSLPLIDDGYVDESE